MHDFRERSYPFLKTDIGIIGEYLKQIRSEPRLPIEKYHGNVAVILNRNIELLAKMRVKMAFAIFSLLDLILINMYSNSVYVEVRNL